MTRHTQFLKISPTSIAAWQSPTELRFGFTTPQLILSRLSSGAATLISSLLTGTTEPALRRAATRVGVTDTEYTELLTALTPVLQHTATPETPTRKTQKIRFTIAPPLLTTHTDYPLLQHLNSALENFGATPDPHKPQVIITLHRYLISSRSSDHWSRKLLPQVPVVFADTEIRVGPFTDAAGYPCATCHERQRVAADPHKPALAAQLLEHTAATETPELVKIIAPTLAQTLRNAATHSAHGSTHRNTLECYRFTQHNKIWLPAAAGITAAPHCLCRAHQQPEPVHPE